MDDGPVSMIKYRRSSGHGQQSVRKDSDGMTDGTGEMRGKNQQRFSELMSSYLLHEHDLSCIEPALEIREQIDRIFYAREEAEVVMAMPTYARSASERPPLVVFKGCSMSDSTPPEDSARVKMCR